MSSYNGGGQSMGGNPTQRGGPPMYQGGMSGSGTNWSPGSGANMPGPTQYPIQSTGPAGNQIMTFDDTARYQQGGAYQGTGGAYDPSHTPGGAMRGSFADPAGYEAARMAHQAQLGSLGDSWAQQNGARTAPGMTNMGQRPGFGPPPPVTGGGDPYLGGGMGNPGGFGNVGMPGVTHGDLAYLGGGGFGLPPGMRMPTLPTRRNTNGY